MLSNKVSPRQPPIIITIAGGTASGKTTIAGIISEHVKELGQKPYVLSLDNYYKTPNEIPKVNGESNFDDPNALDLNRAASDLRDLKNGKPAQLPYGYFGGGERGFNTVKPDDYDYIIVEGIFALYHEGIRKSSDLKIFVGPSLKYELESYLNKCLEKRIARDLEERKDKTSCNAEDIKKYFWAFVFDAYEKYVVSCIHHADEVLFNDFTDDDLEKIRDETKVYVCALQLRKFSQCVQPQSSTNV